LQNAGAACSGKGVKKWQILSSEVIWHRPWFGLQIDRVQTGRGAILEEYPVVHSRDWACTVPITIDGQVVLVRQYRHGVQRDTLEFPAGGVDPGEPHAEAAVRELREETGYLAKTWQHLRSIPPEPTRRMHLAHLYLATGAEQTATQKLEPGEDAEVVLHPADDFDGLVQRLDHAVHVAAAYLARDVLGGRLF
jgi:ADP-ribose pyrophosphatase